MNTNTTFDLAIIGGGPGGYVAAIRAAQLGMKAAVIEKQELGGTCLNVGCIPSKALLDSTELYAQARNGFKRHGITATGVTYDLGVMMKRKDRVVQAMCRGVQFLMKKNNITVLSGAGRIRAANSIEVTGGTGTFTIQANRILIATGSVPQSLPHIPFDGHRIISSTEALALTQTPATMTVIGAGAIGLELGSVWSRLGAHVQVVEMMDAVMPGQDRELTTLLQRCLEKQGLKFLLQSSVQSVDTTDTGCHLHTQTPGGMQEWDSDIVLVAVGRKPCTTGLGIEDLGMTVDQRGRILVDIEYQTSIPGIYAIGDVIPGPMLAHRAEEDGVAAVDCMAGRRTIVNPTTIPGVVYTEPELASVGLTEEQTSGRSVRIGRFPFIANGRARAMEAVDGLVKVIADADNGALLGVHILGPRASDLIAEAVTAMELGATAEQLGHIIHAHPTLPEALREASMAAGSQGIHG